MKTVYTKAIFCVKMNGEHIQVHATKGYDLMVNQEHLFAFHDHM